jgi:dolichyl-phosphate beta-glucosyltransferase
MDVALSLVIPAYNEAQRLPVYLPCVRRYLDDRYPDRYEVIVVDDGSRDGLPDVLVPVESDWPQLAVLRHATNRGKGAAVQTGMLAARGRLLLFADADGATPIEEESKLASALEAGADIAVGSRYIAGDDVSRERFLSRGVAGRLFAGLARRLLDVTVRDTQCGFKMFRHPAGRELFEMLRETGYLFDLEVLALAAQIGYEVVEVPINWSEIPGGSMNILRDSPRMFLGLFRLRRRLGLRAAAKT